MRKIIINDVTDERVRDFTALTDVDLRKVREPAEGLFLAEGEKVIRRAYIAGYRPRASLMTERWYSSIRDVVEEPNCMAYIADEATLEAITGYNVHRGALMSFERRPLPAVGDLLADARRIVILEDLVDHTNVGAIFRNAAALGIDAVLVTPSCADPLYRRSIKVSMATVFAVPWTRIEPWPQGLSDVTSAGFTCLSMTPDPSANSLHDVDLDQRIAIVLGTEGQGLSQAAFDACDLRIRIPMSGGVDSLNVSAASAITFFALQDR
jgi:tRNA G18 (ribose-2'-O)-methylase SpoU